MKDIIKKESQSDLAQAEIFSTLIESVLPMITPIIKPATKKFEEFMNDDNMIFIRTVKGKVHIFHVKASDVDLFSLKEGKKTHGVYSVDDFIANLLSGKFGSQ